MTTKQKIENYLDKIIFGAILFLAFATPLFFAPFFASAFEFPKQVLVVAAASVLLPPYALLLYLRGRSPRLGGFAFALLGLALAYAFATLFSQAKPLSLINGGTVLAFALFFLYLFATEVVSGNQRRITALILALLSSAAIASLVGIASFFGVRPELVGGRNFNPVGGDYAFTAYLLFSLGLALSLVLTRRVSLPPGGRNSSTRRVFAAFGVTSSLVILTGLLFTSPATAPSLDRFLPPDEPYPQTPRLGLSTSWSITAETLRFYPIFGSGPGTFLNDFQRFRPAEFNLSPVWERSFSQAGSFLFEILATLGIAGLIALAWIFLSSLQTLRTALPQTPGVGVSLTPGVNVVLIAPYLLLLILGFFLPFSPPLLFALFVLPAAWYEAPKESLATVFYRTPFYLRKGALLTAFLLAVLLLYGTFRVTLAEVYYKKGLGAASAEQPGEIIYEHLRRAVNLNPYRDSYRTDFAKVSLSLAISLSKGEDLTDERRTQIIRLASQAVEQARIAAELNPLNSQNWQTRSQIYGALIDTAQGAGQWAFASLDQAISLNPNHPLLLVSRGRFLIASELPDEAIFTLRRAVLAKPDLTAAHYSLAQAYKLSSSYGDKAGQNLQAALSELKSALTLLEKDVRERGLSQEEYERQRKIVEEEIAGLEKGISEVAKEEPEKIPPGTIQPPLKLSPEGGLP